MEAFWKLVNIWQRYCDNSIASPMNYLRPFKLFESLKFRLVLTNLDILGLRCRSVILCPLSLNTCLVASPVTIILSCSDNQSINRWSELPATDRNVAVVVSRSSSRAVSNTFAETRLVTEAANDTAADEFNTQTDRAEQRDDHRPWGESSKDLLVRSGGTLIYRPIVINISLKTCFPRNIGIARHS